MAGILIVRTTEQGWKFVHSFNVASSVCTYQVVLAVGTAMRRGEIRSMLDLLEDFMTARKSFLSFRALFALCVNLPTPTYLRVEDK